MSFLFPLKNAPQVVVLKHLVQDFRNFIAPEEFQRPIAWDNKNRKAFFQSILMDRVEGSYVVVDISKCYSKIQRRPESDPKAYGLFRELNKKGKEFIILDGNNRLSFLLSLLGNEYSIPPGTYQYVEDRDEGLISPFTVKGRNTTFNDLPVRVQRAIEERSCIVSRYTQIGYLGMSDVFGNVNSGVAPNAQELRNAYCTDWSEYVREIRYEIAPLLSRIFKDFNHRLKGDEWVADCLDLVLNAMGWDDEKQEDVFRSVTQTSKNKLYRSDFLEEEDAAHIKQTFIQVMDLVDKMIDQDTISSQEIRQSSIQNLFCLVYDGLDSYDQVVMAMKLHQDCYTDKKCITVTENGEEKTFRTCCDGLSKENVSFRHEILDKIFQQVCTEVQV